MKVVIVHPPEPVFSIARELVQHPINLAQLVAAVDPEQADCRIWDYGVEPYSDTEFQARLASFSPDVVGFSCVTPLVKTGARMAALTKQQLPEALTIVGGPHVSAMAQRTLDEFPSFDLGVVGEGELTFSEILSKRKQGKSIRGIQGTVYRHNGGIRLAPLRPLIPNLDALPYPRRDLIDLSRYIGSSSPGLSTRTRTITELFTSRGCPVWCIFCGSHVTHRGKVRFRSAQHVLGEVHHCIERYGIDHFTIDDDTFTYGKKRLLDICDSLADLPITWDCDSRVDSIDETTLRRMARAGCIKIAFGVESGSPRILRLIRKRIRRDQIENSFRWARRAGIMTSGFVMIGSHPTETREDLDETLRFMKRVRPDFLMVYCAVPYPGTDLHELMVQNNLILSEDWDEYDIVRTRPVWRTFQFTPDQLVRQQQRLYRGFYFRPSFVFRKLMDLRSWSDVRYLMESGASLLKYVLSKDRLQGSSAG